MELAALFIGQTGVLFGMFVFLIQWNIMPRFTAIDKRLEQLDRKIDNVYNELRGRIEAK